VQPSPPTVALAVTTDAPEWEWVVVELTVRVRYHPPTGGWRTPITGVVVEDFRARVPEGAFPLPSFVPGSRWPTGADAKPEQLEDLLTMAQLCTGMLALWVEGYDGIDPMARPWALAFPELMQPWLARWRAPERPR
jgi:hypothetical protein